ncbi:MAG: arylsulfatase [Isosphaeraceae bacterium]|nr:arylsulfatase [Isosphaeraceae bacterium]
MNRLGVAAVILATTLASARAAEQPPNIVLILADDLGIGHVGCYGQRKIATPQIDRLAAEGMRFTRFYSGAAVCAPARSVLMTGLHTGHTPVRNNGMARHLYDQDVTIAEVLKRAGYVTGGFGKWGLGGPETPGVAVQQGFDEWFGQYSQVHAHFHYPAFLMHNREQVPLPENAGRQRVRYAPDVIHGRALEFIRANRDRPFFAYLAYTLPHVELTVPASSRRPYEGRWPRIARQDPRPGYLGSDDAYAEFAGMVSHLDHQVGEVLALLEELGLDRRTIVLFSSDNGPQPGAWSDIFVEFFDGNGPFRGAKGSFYEGGIRAPLLARWPGVIAPGSVSDHIGYFGDVMATLAELAEATRYLPEHDGISFAPTLRGQPERQQRHEYLYWEADGTHQDIVQQAVRLGDWKAVRPGSRAGWKLYDLAADPGEQRDIAAEHPDVLRQIEAIAAAAHRPERVYDPGQREGVNDYVK